MIVSVVELLSDSQCQLYLALIIYFLTDKSYKLIMIADGQN